MTDEETEVEQFSALTDPKNNEALYKSWMAKIDDALLREKAYRTEARKVVSLYEGDKVNETPFSILYSNTETLVPAVYSAVPIPMVMRRFKDADPVGKSVAETVTRTLKYLIEVTSADYDCFDELIQANVLSALLVNRGLTRFRFSNSAGHDCVFGEEIRWDKVFHGYARTWKKIPFFGFEWDMTLDELKQNFPDIPFNVKALRQVSGKDLEPEKNDQIAGVKLYKVYEIWNKTDRTVLFLTPAFPRGYVKKIADPLGLAGFFPFPKPLNFLRKTSTLIPTPLYLYYKSQAEELNEVTRRLKAIIKAIRYRGAYNKAVDGIDKMLQAEDNELVPVENMQSMPDGTTMDALIWTVPVQELATTAQNLYQHRESIKQVIYEITGISDILRGASVASETATAQNLKNQWGSLRLRKMQKEVQRYCRDSLAIMAEIAALHFELPTFQAMTGLPYLQEAQKSQIQQQLQMAAMQAQAAGQQPAQPPIEVLHSLQLPTWESVIGLMQNNLLFHYRIDIETNSTVEAEATQDKQDIAELLNALSQFLNGMAPLVQNGSMPFEIAKQILLVISRRYNFGSQLEDAINAMQEPKPPTDSGADQAKVEAVKLQAQVDAQKSQQELQLSQLEFQQKMSLMQKGMELKVLEAQIRENELRLQAQATNHKLQVQTAQHRLSMEKISTQSKEPA